MSKEKSLYKRSKEVTHSPEPSFAVAKMLNWRALAQYFLFSVKNFTCPFFLSVGLLDFNLSLLYHISCPQYHKVLQCACFWVQPFFFSFVSLTVCYIFRILCWLRHFASKASLCVRILFHYFSCRHRSLSVAPCVTFKNSLFRLFKTCFFGLSIEETLSLQFLLAIFNHSVFLPPFTIWLQSLISFRRVVTGQRCESFINQVFFFLCLTLRLFLASQSTKYTAGK